MQATRDFSHYVRHLESGLSHIDLAVEGVSCAGCMSKIERGLSAIPDVTLARVNLTDRRVALEWKQGGLDPIHFIDRLAELGYKAYPFETAGAEALEAEQSPLLLRCLGVAASAPVPVLMLSMQGWAGAGSLAALKAETATRSVGADEISEVPVAAIEPGDIVLLRPGERCAIDGTVIEGRSEIDQSLITGETLHITAEHGTAVYAG